MIKRIFWRRIKIHDETQNMSNQGSGFDYIPRDIYIYNLYIGDKYIYIERER